MYEISIWDYKMQVTFFNYMLALQEVFFFDTTEICVN